MTYLRRWDPLLIQRGDGADRQTAALVAYTAAVVGGGCGLKHGGRYLVETRNTRLQIRSFFFFVNKS